MGLGLGMASGRRHQTPRGAWENRSSVSGQSGWWEEGGGGASYNADTKDGLRIGGGEIGRGLSYGLGRGTVKETLLSLPGYLTLIHALHLSFYLFVQSAYI